MNNHRILAIIILCVLAFFILYMIYALTKPSTEEPTIDISTSLASALPTPSHYDEYEIVTDTDKLFCARIDGMPFDDFDDYIKDCKQAGYTEHSYYVGNYLYYGESSEGQCVQLTFNTYTDELVVQVAADAKDPDKWRW